MTAPARHTTRFAEETDIDAVAQLLRAMDEHYRPGDALPAPADYAAMAAAAMARREGTRFVLCLHGQAPLGLGCLAVLRPGRDLAGLVFIKDLFVRAEWRGRGLGAELMRFIAGFAMSAGIGRIDLATDESNEGARKLYEKLGGRLRPAVYYTFAQDALQALAESQSL